MDADRHLLDLCAESLYALVHAEKAYNARDSDWGHTAAEQEACRAKRDNLMGQY